MEREELTQKTERLRELRLAKEAADREEKIHPVMVVTKRSLLPRNDFLISGVQLILDAASAAKCREAIRSAFGT